MKLSKQVEVSFHWLSLLNHVQTALNSFMNTYILRCAYLNSIRWKYSFQNKFFVDISFSVFWMVQYRMCHLLCLWAKPTPKKKVFIILQEVISMCECSAMKEVKQNENCIDTAKTFTTENNVAVPQVYCQLYSPLIRDKKMRQFLFSVTIILSWSTAVLQEQH